MPAISLGSLAAGDTAAFSESYDTPAVGKTLTPAGSVDDGNSGSNYAVTFVNNASGTIVNANETTALVWPGPDRPLSLTESIPGGTPSIAVSELTAGVSRGTTGAGHVLAAGLHRRGNRP